MNINVCNVQLADMEHNWQVTLENILTPGNLLWMIDFWRDFKNKFFHSFSTE
jgi:hypothetical protein